jgi:hypothetical protein
MCVVQPVQHLPRMCETLGPIPSTKKIRSETASLPLLDLKALPTQNTGVGMWGGEEGNKQ